MKLYITDPSVSADKELYAEDIHGNEITEELLLSFIATDSFRENGGVYDIKPYDYTRSFFRMTDELKAELDSDADYGMCREIFNTFIDCIEKWEMIVGLAKSGKLPADLIGKNYSPQMMKYLS